MDGSTYEDDLDVRNQIVRFYEYLYKETDVRRRFSVGIPLIGRGDKALLRREFEKEFQQAFKDHMVSLWPFSRRSMKLVSLKNP